MRLFEHPKHMFKLIWVRKYLQFYAQKLCLSKPMLWVKINGTKTLADRVKSWARTGLQAIG